MLAQRPVMWIRIAVRYHVGPESALGSGSRRGSEFQLTKFINKKTVTVLYVKTFSEKKICHEIWAKIGPGSESKLKVVSRFEPTLLGSATPQITSILTGGFFALYGTSTRQTSFGRRSVPSWLVVGRHFGTTGGPMVPEFGSHPLGIAEARISTGTGTNLNSNTQDNLRPAPSMDILENQEKNYEIGRKIRNLAELGIFNII